jgi:predicted component of type VI protein secretion system
MKVYRDLLQADPHNDEIRQKLVELKHRIEAQNSAPTVTPATIEEVPAPTGEPAVASETAAQGEAAQQVAVLTRWLDSISRRRADVR